MIGQQFDVGDEICGAVISIRHSEDILSIWNKTAKDGETNTTIRYINNNHCPIFLLMLCL
jgi:translation initiation factor 4E